MGCGRSRETVVPSFHRLREQQQATSDPAPTPAPASAPASAPAPQARSTPTHPKPAQRGWASAEYEARKWGSAGHSAECCCIICEPRLYDKSGNLKTGYRRPCNSPGCICPVCAERKRCQVRSKGHWLPGGQQCRNEDCACKLGCEDLSCRTCISAISRHSFKGGSHGYI